MPKYHITSPDGTKYEVNAPEGATEQQALAYFQSNYKPPAPQQAQQENYDPTEGMSTFDKLAAGAGKAAYDVYRGGRQMLGLASQSEIDDAKRLDAPLMKTGAGMAGNIAANIATAAPAMLIPGANTVVGAGLLGGAMGALQPTATGESRAQNIAVSGALGAAGQYAGNKLRNYISNKISARQADQVANATKDATLKASQEAGYVVPPTQANPSTVNKALEGLSGKLTTAQRASEKNQAVTDRLVKSALGLTDDTPITRETLASLRQGAGQAYEAVKSIGQVSADKTYISALNGIKARFEGAAKDFPGIAKPEVSQLVDSLAVPQFGADSAVDAISVLRESAEKAYASGDKGLGKAYKSASDAMESLLERNLAKTGQGDLLKQFKSARQLIAKTYTVENALNDATGKVSAAKLAGQLTKGKPLTNELKQVAKFAQAFPKAAQDVQKMGSLPGLSPLDYGVGLISGTAGGFPAASAVFLRPGVRAGILSGPYQRLMTTPSYSTGLLSAGKGALEKIPQGAVLPGIYLGQQ